VDYSGSGVRPARIPGEQLAEAAGLSMSRVYQIREKSSGGQPPLWARGPIPRLATKKARLEQVKRKLLERPVDILPAESGESCRTRDSPAVIPPR